MKLFDKIESLRALAATIYDSGKKSQVSKEQLAGAITPIRERLEKAIQKSVKHDVKDCVAALKLYEAQMASLDETIAFMIQKKLDSETYIGKIKSALYDRMVDEDRAFLIDDGFTVSLVDSEITFK